MRKQLNGYVVDSSDAFFYRYFGMACCCADDVRTAVQEYADGGGDDEGLIFEVNSPGGSAFSGFEMWTALRDAKRVHSVRCIAEVQSIAASAASIFTSGCDEVRMSPVAQLMIHLPATRTEGDETDHLESLGMLQAGLNSILAAYEAKCKGKTPRDQLEALTRATSFINAQQAVDIGLADTIIAYDEAEPGNPTAMVAALGLGIQSLTAACGLPDIAQLRAKYTQQHPQAVNGGTEGSSGDDPEAGSPPAASDTPIAADDLWKLRARLDLAKAKA